jgi:small redox-active disulfide protein 2
MLNIKVLGSGCPNCHKLEQLCHEVVSENSLEAKIELDSDFDKYWKLGIMMTPALIVNGKVLAQGKIPVKHTLVHWLTDFKTNM